MMRRAVAHVNRLKPRFVVVCGDLVNAMPETKPAEQAAQVKEFKDIARLIDDDIALVCVCGNHGGVAERPMP